MAGSGAAAAEQLCGMFAQVDRAVVEAVLESVNGDLDRALDQLLKIAAEQDQAAGAARPSESPDVAATGATVGEPERAAEAASPSSPHPWRKLLPPDFLRLPSDVKVRLEDLEQLRADELFAHILANEGFRRELAQHHEFSSHSGSDWASSTWGDLSEAAKTKFNALATQFRRSRGYQPLEGSEDHSLNVLMPSGGTSACSRRHSGPRSDVGDTELSNLGGMSRMKIQ